MKDSFFTKASKDRTRGNVFKLKGGRLGIRKTFFMMRVMRHWNRLPREIVKVPPSDVFKVWWDWALSNLI